MTLLDEAPEHRWRRTVDRRNRPAKLKVDRLLRDFGYAELDPDVGDAIEARLAGVALAVAPSLRNAVAGEVVTIYANDSPASPEGRATADAPAVAPPPAEAPAAASDVAQMVTYLKQQVLDARGEAERLRTELDRRIAARMDSERESERIIAEQAAALEHQSRQLAELSAALDSTRQALADTRDEIRRAVGELQALPEPEPAGNAPAPYAETGFAPPDPDVAADEDTGDEGGLSGEQWGDGREEAEAAGSPTEDAPADEEGPAARDVPESAATAPAADAGIDLDEPDTPVEAPVPAAQDPALELDDPDLEVEASRPRAAPEPDFDLDVPLQAAPERAPAVEDPVFDLDEAPLGSGDEFDLGEREASVPARPEPADDLDAPLPPSNEWLPVDLRSPGDEDASVPAEEVAAPAGEAATGEEGAADFDDFLYDADELYVPDTPDAGGVDSPLESEIEAQWPDDPETALPPPPPAPPSPWAEEPDPQPSETGERATLGKVLRGRGGRGRGRWEGTCSICGRLPQVTRRKDLQAAGWDLDDDAAACPQCRGVG
ncbi:MAG: hypothetical protein Q8K79_13215 [Solirubrobacteraceae bacterium]|nr:hypothetical protein [Solirubrobacteraceae bacterium]